jgi:hypothetical protein
MIQQVLHNPAQAHQALTQLWATVKNNLVAGHKQVIELRDYEDKKSDQQRRYYHGYVLNEIAKQAVIEGNRYGLGVWKEHFRKLYLGKKRVKLVDPMTGKKSYRYDRVSSESLGVKGYTRLIEQVTSFAANDLNVKFYVDIDTWIAENEV